MKVLVTGATGFIGSHMTNFLKEMDYEVIALDIRPKNDAYLKLKCDKFLQYDLRDSYNTHCAVQGIEHIYHFAAHMGGIEYITSVGAEIMRDNSLINLNILDACRHNNISRLFFSSSACAYPTFKQTVTDLQPLKESDAVPADPDNYYGWEKLYMEKLIEAYQRDHNLEIRTVRYHNIYGPYGDYQGGKEKAPGALCRKVALAKDGEKLEVWGDGQQTRSFCYIRDCLLGTYILMNSDYSVPVNIGSDDLVTMDDLANLIIQISGKDLTIRHNPKKPQGVRGRNADLTLVRKEIGWEPKISLYYGLTATYNWINKQVNK